MSAQAQAGGAFAARRAALAAGFVLAFVAVGMLGTYRYLRGFWLYRGFPPPADPAFVAETGTTQTLGVTSPALGGRTQQVIVYLPPGYDTDTSRRYPVLYLLHGFPGRPAAFLETVRMGVVEDVLVAKGRAQPLILVMPMGSTGTFTDKEWADGYRRYENWATFVSRDLVHTIDARYRTIASGSARAIAGLSEGGYGALNIGIRHPNEFHVLESWSGYEKADPLEAIFGGDQARFSRTHRCTRCRLSREPSGGTATTSGSTRGGTTRFAGRTTRSPACSRSCACTTRTSSCAAGTTGRSGGRALRVPTSPRRRG